ncbi:MAG: response regulator [Planctomycetota bacterium]|nr:MAG: response regulator [Planctomycetota bacterium]
MKLRSKLLLVLGAVLATVALGFHSLASRWLQNGYGELERTDCAEARAAVESALDALRDDLCSKLADWAMWDDTYRFMEDGNRAFVESNLLPDSIGSIGISAIAFLSDDGRLLESLALAERESVAVPLWPGLEQRLRADFASLGCGDPERVVAGLWRLPEGPMVVASRPVLPSSGVGAPRGRIVFLRRLDAALFARIADQTREHCALVEIADRGNLATADAAALDALSRCGAEHGLDQPRDDAHLATYYLAADIAGLPTWLVRVDRARPIWAAGRASVRTMTSALIGVGVLFGLIAMAFMEQLVLARLTRLEREVRAVRGDAEHARVYEAGSDELSTLGQGINRMLERVEAMRSALTLREREASRLALLASRTDQMALIGDGAGRIEWVNAAFERESGYTLAAARGKTVTELFGGAAAPAPTQAGTSVALLRRSDGTCFSAELDLQLVSSDRHGGLTTIGLARNVTARFDAERELVAAKEQAEAAARAKSDFLANMSHEIRTPMTAILGFADLLADPALAPLERIGHIQTIRRNGQHLLAVINDILDLSKIEAGKLSLEAIAFDPRQVVEDVLSMCRPRALEKQLTLTSELGQRPLPVVLGDPTRLRQVLMNLVSNAVKFTSQGGVSVRVARSGDDETGCRLGFEVADTGVGMEPEQQERLFHAFQQADTSTTRRFGGTGLGLAISQRLVQAMRGSIAVASRPGEGSTFRFELCFPLASAEQQPQHATQPGATPALVELPRLDGMRVLLAEDGLDNQRLIRSILTRQGARVQLAENGRVAVDSGFAALRRGEVFDVVLMDMQMPELDGYAATTQLRVGGYDGAIIALTAHAMEGDRKRCLAAGCDDYATKPIQRLALIPLLAAWRGRRSERAAA